MKILAIDTTTKKGSVALLENQKTLAELPLLEATTTAEQLLPGIVKVLEQTGITVGQLDAIAVSIGPGSFTGLRIGLASAKAISLAQEIPLVGVSSLLALSLNIEVASTIVPVLDAKRGEIFAAAFSISSKTLEKIIIPEQAFKPDVLCKLLSDLGPILLVGDALEIYSNFLKQELPKAQVAPKDYWPIKASHIGFLGYQKLKLHPEGDGLLLAPTYLRGSDAEVKKKANG